MNFILGLPTTSVLRSPVATLDASTTARAEAAGGTTTRRIKKFYDGAGSRSRCERIIARVETGTHGFDARFIVTSPTRGPARR